MDTIEPFSDDFWTLMRIVDEAPDMPDGSVDNLGLEERGWIEKRLVTWPVEGGMFGSIVEKKQGYQTHITRKTKKWLKDLNAITPKSLAKMLPDPVNWTNHFLEVAGCGNLGVYYSTWTPADDVGKRSNLAFDAALTQLDIIKKKQKRARYTCDSHSVPLPDEDDDEEDPFSNHNEYSNVKLTPKGKRLLAELIELCGDQVLSEMFKYFGQRQKLFCISNLRLLSNPLRKLSADDWLDKFKNYDKGERRETWQRKTTIQHTWNYYVGVNLSLVGRELPAFKEAVARLLPEDWEWLAAPEFNPMVLLILSNMPEFASVGKTPKDVLEEKHLICWEHDYGQEHGMRWIPGAIDKLACYGEGHLFEAGIDDLPLAETAILLVKANPSIRRVIAPKLKARLAQQDEDEKLGVC